MFAMHYGWSMLLLYVKLKKETEKLRQIYTVKSIFESKRRPSLKRIKDSLYNCRLLRWFLTFTLRILSAHNLWRHLARPCARTHQKHGGFALILSSVSWKMAIAHPMSTGTPPFFSSHCNQLIISFAREKTHLISIIENWINKENSR